MGKDEGEILPKKTDQERLEADFEMFLRDVEEDPELRQTLAVYKANQQKAKSRMNGVEEDAMSVAETEDTEDEQAPKINMEELLEDFDELNVQDTG